MRHIEVLEANVFKKQKKKEKQNNKETENGVFWFILKINDSK